MGNPECRVRLTGGNIRNHHFYLHDCRAIIPDRGIGGGRKAEARRPFTVRFKPGPTVETDVDGKKMILRDRRAARSFLELAGAIAGDMVVVEGIGDRAIEVRLDR